MSFTKTLAVGALFFLLTTNGFLLTARAQTPRSSENISLSLSSHDRRAALIPAGATEATIDILADPAARGGDLVEVTYFVPSAAVTLTLPGGVEVNSGNASAQGFTYGVFSEGSANNTPLAALLSSSGTHTLIRLPQSAPAGTYKVKVTIPAAQAATPVVVTYLSSSRVQAGLATNAKVYAVGDTVVIMAALFDELTPITGAAVNVELVDDAAADAVPVRVVLSDSGTYDAAPGDGIYTGTFAAIREGNIVAAMRASGVSGSGVSFSRTASATFEVGSPLARFTSFQNAAVDDDSDQRFDRIVVTANVEVQTSGEYKFSATLSAGNGAEVSASTTAVLQTGSRQIALQFSSADVYGLNTGGPYKIKNASLFFVTPADSRLTDYRSEAGETAAHQLSSFSNPRRPDLAVTLVDAPDPVLTYDPLTYSISVYNVGSAPAAALVVKDQLPAGVTLVSASTTRGVCSGTSLVTCSNITLEAGASFTVTLVVLPAAAGTLTNTASASCHGEVVLSNNSATAVTSVATKPWGPTAPKSNGKIAFARNEDIYVMNADGSDQVNLTKSTGNFDPAWSPDGSKLAFASTRQDPVNYTSKIYVMNANGSGLVCLSPAVSDDYYPVWSPDGKKIAFKSWRDNDQEIYVVNADGTNEVRLTNLTGFDDFPAWSPDGTKIAFERFDSGPHIYTVRADGTGLTKLTSDVYSRYPAWSPAGDKIAFSGQPEPTGTDQIYVMNADGSGLAAITQTNGGAFRPAWSPDGTRIAYVDYGVRPGGLAAEILLISPDGNNPLRLTDSPDDKFEARWAPDGSQLIYPGRAASGIIDIFVAAAAGGGTPSNITADSTEEDSPSWQPQPAPRTSTIDLALVKSHEGTFYAGLTGVYTLRVDNVGTADTTGTITVTDYLPDGLSFVSAAGEGWSCSAAGQVVTCSNPSVLPANQSTSLTLSVGVAGAAVPRVINLARVAVSGDQNAANNTASDSTAVNATYHTISGRVADRNGAGIANVQVTLGGQGAATASTGADGGYTLPGVPATGTYSITPALNGYLFTPASRTLTALAADQSVNFTGFQPTPVTSGNVLISEFRFRGPAAASTGSGALDEFVELYNNTDSPITVGAGDGSQGWALAGADGAVRFVVPNGTLIPARGHYLAVNANGYSLAQYPNGGGAPSTGDVTYTADIADDSGMALFKTANPSNFNTANRLDAVGFNNPNGPVTDLYREGAGLAPVGNQNGEHAFVRKTVLGPGTPQDSGDNASDFRFVATDGAIYNGIQSQLGSPGPENLSSPIQRNATIALALIDPSVGSSQPPNRSRDFTSDLSNNSTFGKLIVRRQVTNNTGAPVTRVRFRVIDVTTYPAPGGVADLRPITSGPDQVTVQGVMRTVEGTTLEQPPGQPNGGGYNSTLSIGTVTLATPLAPGASVDLRFVLGIQQTGSFRFYLNIEALP